LSANSAYRFFEGLQEMILTLMVEAFVRGSGGKDHTLVVE
jgi:hypothetical protein